MRVMFDPQTFLRQRTGGISRLFSDLIAEFDSDQALGVDAVLPFTWVNNLYAPKLLPAQALKTMPDRLPRGLLYAPWVLRGLPSPRQTDVVHHTYYSRRFLGNINGAARVCTVYDMIPEMFRGTAWFTGSHLAKRAYVSRSDLVICISESTRQDMLDHFDTPRGKVVVVPSSVGPGFSPDLAPLSELPHEYLLYVGRRAGYKDFDLLPRAIAELKSRGIHIPVVIVGPPITKEEEEELSRVGVDSMFIHRPLDDAGLKRAYAHCSALVQTSRYEGFGMTPLEAMASGAPAVIANASSMPEVGGEVARYFEPGDAESLAETLEALLTDDVARAELGRRGVERARLFSARRMAERTAAAYREVLSL